MSRREALRAGGMALIGAATITPADAWAATTGRCPHPRVKCNGHCCPAGEVCHPPRHKSGNPFCDCPKGTRRCGGKCVNVRSSVANCGACGHHCPAGRVCSDGKCVLKCAAGTVNCGGACVDLQGDPQHCGACGTVCSGGTQCSGGQCICPAGTALCGSVCINMAADVHNCGSCGSDCTTLPNVSPAATCAGGTCTFACLPGYGNCDGQASTGCETHLDTVTNCGACGNNCTTLPNVSPGATCVGGTCTFGCLPGYGNCDGQASTGCETRLNTVTNCGACGHMCGPSQTCAAGQCV